mgnify:CR=1 FL=1
MDESEQLAHVNWSPSAARLFEECPRRFFYRYQQSASTGDDSEYTPPPGAYLGTVVHESLAAQIVRWRQGENIHLQTAVDYASDKLEGYAEANAETIAARIDDDEGEFNSESFIRSLIRTAREHIRRFFRVIWPHFDGHRYIIHETRQNLDIAEEPVAVQPDLCTRSTEGDFVVTDWKTGEYDRFSNPTLQMQAYALYAHEAYEPELNRIRVQLAHTGSGEFERMVPTRDGIRQVRERIMDDRAFWTSQGNVESYETDPVAQKCSQCSYLLRCRDGQAVVGGGPEPY